MFCNADALNLPLPNGFADLVLGSPPYTDRRTYGLVDGKRGCFLWVDWMLAVTRESLRIAKGPVMWVVNGCIKDGKYQPAVEGLIWEAYKLGLNCEHPLIWSKNAAPNRRNWWCNGWEFIIAFYPDEWDHKFNWRAVATPQKFAKGGGFRQRGVNGKRRISPPKPRADFARPYDVIRATVGGGHLGHPLAHDNEAPYPESLVEPVILALSDGGDIVVDPFCGSGTTVAVANRLGRRGYGFDCRNSQILLANRRCYGQATSPGIADLPRYTDPNCHTGRISGGTNALA